jgi:hypothetical protein
MNFNNLNLLVIFFMFHLGNYIIRFVKPKKMCIRISKKTIVFCFYLKFMVAQGGKCS